MKTLTNLEVISLYNKLYSLSSVPTFTLNRARTLTLKSLKPLYDAFIIDKMCPKNADYVEYEKRLNDGYKELASVNGVPKTKILNTESGQATILDFDINSAEAIKLRLTLDTEFQKVLKEREQQLVEYKEWLLQPCTEKYTLEAVTIEDMPKGDEDYKNLWDAFSYLIP